MPTRSIALFSLVLLMLLAGGCKGRGGPMDFSKDWEKAYVRSGSRIVVDRFEIDTRNDEAIAKVFDYRDADAVISAQGGGLLTTLDGVEVFGVSPRIRKGLRYTDTQGTLRTTQQFTLDLANKRWPRRVELPVETAGYLAATPVGSSELVELSGLYLELGPPVDYEEGISLRTLLTGEDARRRPLDVPLSSFDLFLEPNRSIVIRTAPVAGGNSPLSFDRAGQDYETVFVISYIKVRNYPPPIREYLNFW